MTSNVAHLIMSSGTVMDIGTGTEDRAIDSDEGLGTVYERFMLNRLFDRLLSLYPIERVLEVPIYGMTGLTGINSVHFARRGCRVTLIEPRREKVDEAERLWEALPCRDKLQLAWQDDLSRLPFDSAAFDLSWNFAALWHLGKPEDLLAEMARVSSRVILIVVPNRWQAGYIVRKHFLDTGFFKRVDENWVEPARLVSILAPHGWYPAEMGVLDVPPWPDTCFPIRRVLSRLQRGGASAKPADRRRWSWDIMSYYLGRDRTLKTRVERYSFIETMPIPWRLKVLWAHHRYVVFSRN